MHIVERKLEEITAALTTLEAPWQDEHAARVMALVQSIPAKKAYSDEDAGKLFDENFDAAFTAAYLFLGISKDEFQDRLAQVLPGPNGVTRFKQRPGQVPRRAGQTRLTRRDDHSRKFRANVERHPHRTPS